jgi:integrase
MKSLTRVELDALLRVARLRSESDYLMFKLAFYHGLRISEVLSLSAENIVGGCLIIQRLKGSKRTIQPLPADDREAIEKLAANGGPFFMICRKTAWLHMKEYGREAGIPEYKCTPHKLKHTAGVLGLKGGMTLPEVQARLGHVSGSSTMVYLQVDEDDASKAFAKAVGA